MADAPAPAPAPAPRVDERTFYVGDPTRDGNCGMIALGVLYAIMRKVANPTDRIRAPLKWNGAEANKCGREFRAQLMRFALEKLKQCQTALAVKAYIDAGNLGRDETDQVPYPPAVENAILSPDGSSSWVDWFKINALEDGAIEMKDVEPTDYIYNVLGKPHRMISQIEITLAALMLGIQIKTFQVADDSSRIKSMLTVGVHAEGTDGGFRTLRLLYEGANNSGHYYGMMTEHEVNLFATSVLSVPDKDVAKKMITDELELLGDVVVSIRSHLPRAADGTVSRGDSGAAERRWFDK